MKRIVAVGFLFIATSHVTAQDASLTGTYSGNFQSGNNHATRIVLNIKSVEDGVVKGTIERYASGGGRHGSGIACSGQYPAEGTYKGNTLQVRTIDKGGSGGDCGASLNLQVDGNKLVGKFGKNELTLSK